MINYSTYLPLRIFQAIRYGDKREYLRLYKDCYRDDPVRIRNLSNK